MHKLVVTTTTAFTIIASASKSGVNAAVSVESEQRLMEPIVSCISDARASNGNCQKIYLPTKMQLKVFSRILILKVARETRTSLSPDAAFRIYAMKTRNPIREGKIVNN